jgi:ribulose 1,5-bisphosphate synthetase/thiazole synthase
VTGMWFKLIVSGTVFCAAAGVAPAMPLVAQSARQIPVQAVVDVVVVGSTSAGVAAAEAAAKEGASVFLVAPRFYPGEDLCGTLRLDPGEGRQFGSGVEKALFVDGATPSPSRVKGVLTDRLVASGVRFLYASVATDLLRDAQDRLAGVVIANRAGRQALVAKVVIDATEHAWFCRGPVACATTPWSGGRIVFEQHELEAGGESANPRRGAVPYRMEATTLELELPDLSYRSLDLARDAAREKTYSKSMLRQSETLFFVPPATVVCRRSAADWVAGDTVNVDHFRPKSEARLYVLSGWADIPRDVAAALLRPAALCAAGEAVGRAAAAEAKELPTPTGVRVPGRPRTSAARGDVKELLAGARPVPGDGTTVPGEATVLPVLAEVDVVVVGGGTAGAPAAIAAARRGAKVLVVEFQEGLGGVGTIGQIGKAYHGRNAGFAAEVPYPKNTEEKMEWYRRELVKAGGTMWLRTMGAGAFVDGSVVKGAVVCTPDQRGVVLAKVVIDATGNGDIAVAAGADYLYGMIEQGDIALQGTGFSKRVPGQSYNNSDYLLVDESDMVDVWSALSAVYLQSAGHGGGEASKSPPGDDYSTQILTRERRRVVGDVVIRYIEQLAGRTYADTIVVSQSDYDSHGYPTGPFFWLLPHDAKSVKQNHPAPGGSCCSPYRAFTPKGFDGILVAGLGISMDRDVTAMIRMQRDIANQGYALGIAAAMAAQQGIAPRAIDVGALQRHLVDTGALPEEAISWTDNFPLAPESVEAAVEAFGRATEPKGAGRPLAVILTHRDTALPLVRAAYAKADGEPRLLYARVLASFGDKDVVPFLVERLNAVESWDPRIRQGGMADHAYLPTPVDSLVLALGAAGERSATPALVRMAGLLREGKGERTLSHYRALALAAEQLGDPALAPALASLLAADGKTWTGGAAVTDPDRLQEGQRSESIQEISLARALYRIGDHEGLGRRVLETYRNDKRGLFARHAAAVLAERHPSG